MQTCFIYALFDPRDGALRYVGKADNVAERVRCHVKEARKAGGSHRRHWLRSLLAAGLKPAAVVLETATKDTWAERERWNIATLKRLGFKLVNGTDGGEGSVGYVTSEETRKLISLAHKGKKLTPERAAHFVAAGVKANTGRRFSPQRREQLRAAALRRFRRPGEREAHAARARVFFSRPETKARLSVSAKRRAQLSTRDNSGKFVSKRRYD